MFLNHGFYGLWDFTVFRGMFGFGWGGACGWVKGHFIFISNFLPNPISIIFFKVANSRSDLSFSIRDM
jgi:hypothetical protein